MTRPTQPPSNWAVVGRRWRLIAAVAAVAACAAGIWAWHYPAQYSASADVLLGGSALPTSIVGTAQSGQAVDPERYSETEAQLARVPSVAAHAVQLASVNTTAEQLLADSTVTASPNSDLLY